MIKPLGNRVLVELKPEETVKKTAAGIVLPSSKIQEATQTGKVVAVGTGIKLNSGETIPMDIPLNSNVVFPHYAGTQVVDKDVSYILLQTNEILAVSED